MLDMGGQRKPLSRLNGLWRNQSVVFVVVSSGLSLVALLGLVASLAKSTHLNEMKIISDTAKATSDIRLPNT